MSADDAGNTVESLALTVGTLHSSCFCIVHAFGNPAFHAVGKRWRLDKSPANHEFPAVDTEPAVLDRLLFRCKALDMTTRYRQDTDIFVSHTTVHSRSYGMGILLE